MVVAGEIRSGEYIWRLSRVKVLINHKIKTSKSTKAYYVRIREERTCIYTRSSTYMRLTRRPCCCCSPSTAVDWLDRNQVGRGRVHAMWYHAKLQVGVTLDGVSVGVGVGVGRLALPWVGESLGVASFRSICMHACMHA
jgi:hypothetical protein